MEFTEYAFVDDDCKDLCCIECHKPIMKCAKQFYREVIEYDEDLECETCDKYFKQQNFIDAYDFVRGDDIMDVEEDYYIEKIAKSRFGNTCYRKFTVDEKQHNTLANLCLNIVGINEALKYISNGAVEHIRTR